MKKLITEPKQDSTSSKLIISFHNVCSLITYGLLTIKSPTGKIYNYTGKFPGPNAFIQIKDWQILSIILSKGDIGFAESYINNLWDTDNLEDLLLSICLNEEVFIKYFEGNFLYKRIFSLTHWLKSNTKTGSKQNINSHYSLSNNFYKLWLDKSMTYSGAIFSNDENLSLEKAQQAKYDRITSKLNIMTGDQVLDIGCGWGALAEYLAKKGVHVTAITLSELQAQYAFERIIKANLQTKATIKLQDYRDITGIFDYIISIGMFEHVGKRFWKTYFKVIATHLKKSGKALIQTIVTDEKYLEKNCTNFINYYIFPGGCLPSHNIFINEAKKAGLKCIGSFIFGKDYALTLKHWLARFEKQLPKIKRLGFDEQFIRRWRFYLSCSIATFLSNRTNVVQFELQHG